MKIECMVLGMVQTNTYVVYQEGTDEALIIDPADNAPKIEAKCASLGVKPVAILLTHGHFDHIMAVDELVQQFQCPVYAHELEKQVLTSVQMNLSANWYHGFIVNATDYVKDGQILQLAGFEIRVIHTPGHTPGGCCYYFEKEKVLFSGDTLFLESMGRTDFEGGNLKHLCCSIREKLLMLPDEVEVYPGHEDFTSIGHEKGHNPAARNW